MFHMTVWLTFIRLCILVLILPVILMACGSDVERAALVALYNVTDGPTWDDDGSWLSHKPIWAWRGVATDASGRVTKLDLRGKQLSGELPPEFGNLVKLQTLVLDRNQLSGGDTGVIGQPRQTADPGA